MTTNERANFIEILRGLGWTGDQIADFQLGIEGRLSVEDSIKRVREQERTNQAGGFFDGNDK